MNTRFFRYSGSKFKYIKLVNNYINNTDKTTYVEPFVGSGAIFFNLEKKFNKYILNDIDPNIINIYKTFKKISYLDYINELNFVKNKFGEFKSNKNLSIEQAKANYYNFRNFFNEKYYKSNTIKEGIYLFFLANSCINSMLRFGPNGMNQSFGNCFYNLNEKDFNEVNVRLQCTELYCTDFIEIFKLYPDVCFFLDPPYIDQNSSYIGLSEYKFKIFINKLKTVEYVYTDILNDYNDHLNKHFIRNIKSTSPQKIGFDKNHNEYIFSNIPIKNTDW
jgi:DNA adenine methylase